MKLNLDLFDVKGDPKFEFFKIVHNVKNRVIPTLCKIHRTPVAPPRTRRKRKVGWWGEDSWPWSHCRGLAL